MSKWLFFLESTLLVCALVAVSVILAMLAPSAPDLSAWVQAVGSIAALIIAIFVMAHQNRNAARLMLRQNRHATKLVADADRLATIRRANSVHAVMRRTNLRLQQIERDILTPPQPGEGILHLTSRFNVAMSMIVQIRSGIGVIPAFDLGSFHMADGVLQLSDGLALYEDLLNMLSADPSQAGCDHVRQVLAVHRPHTIDGAFAKFDKGLTELKTENLRRRH